MRACLVLVLCGALVLQGAFGASLERRTPARTESVASPSTQSVEYDAMAFGRVGGKDRKARRSDTRSPRVSSSSFAAKANSEASYRHLGIRGFGTPYEATTLAHVGKGRMTNGSGVKATSDLTGIERSKKIGHGGGYNADREKGEGGGMIGHEGGDKIGHGGGDNADREKGEGGGMIGHGGAKKLAHGRSDHADREKGEGGGMIGHGGGDKIGHGGGDNADREKGEGGGMIGHGGANNLGSREGFKRRSVAQASSDLITSEAKINHDEGYGDNRHMRQSEAQMLPSKPRPSH